jgi:uncharacterized protein
MLFNDGLIMDHYTETIPNSHALIGIISDTHGVVPEAVYKIFDNVDFVIHAGDFGGMEIVKKIESIAPMYAITGNVDVFDLPHVFPKRRQIEISGIKFFIEHNIFRPVNHYLKLKRDPIFSDSDFIIYGHTHFPQIEEYGNYVYFNPGSTTQPRKGKDPSVGLIEVENGKTLRKEIVFL